MRETNYHKIVATSSKDNLRTTINTLPNQNENNLSANTILNYVYGATGIVAVIIIIAAGVQYIITKGDPGKIKKAKMTIIFAIVGLVVVISAAIITNFIFSTVEGAK